MQRISRRVVLGCAAALVPPQRARARASEEITVAADDGAIAASRYGADGEGKRAAVLILHGSGGFELGPATYLRYAHALADAGLDAYLVRYFTAADAEAHDPDRSTRETREAYGTARFRGWAHRVSSVASTVSARPESTARIGLLGFSLGGFVAAQTAAQDDRVTALAVIYGGMPDAMVSRVKHMPPVLELHGDEDNSVPPAKGDELVRLARAAGALAEKVSYPGRGHGFDFSPADPMSADAQERVVRFFHATLT